MMCIWKCPGIGFPLWAGSMKKSYSSFNSPFFISMSSSLWSWFRSISWQCSIGTTIWWVSAIRSYGNLLSITFQCLKVFNGFSLGGVCGGTLLIQLFGNNVSAWHYRLLPISRLKLSWVRIKSQRWDSKKTVPLPVRMNLRAARCRSKVVTWKRANWLKLCL